MARPTIDQIRGLPDFAQVYRWNMIFNRFPNAVPGPSSARLNLQCISADVPKIAGATQELTIRGHSVILPGIWKTSGTIILTFVETVDNLILNFFQNWREATWVTFGVGSGTGSNKVDLLAQIILEELNRQDLPIRRYTIEAIMADYDSGGALADTGDFRKPTLTLAFDYPREEAVAT